MKRDEIARMRPVERKALLEEIAAMVAEGDLRIGEAARVLRRSVLGMDRQRFAKVVKVSERAIANLEDDPEANPRLQTLMRVFAPFGGAVGLVFPRMEARPEPDAARTALRTTLVAALAKSRRRRG